MPAGMYLKSEGFASSLYDPDLSFTLEHFCKENRRPYNTGARAISESSNRLSCLIAGKMPELMIKYGAKNS